MCGSVSAPTAVKCAVLCLVRGQSVHAGDRSSRVRGGNLALWEGRAGGEGVVQTERVQTEDGLEVGRVALQHDYLEDDSKQCT